jgi:hypothetical protein
MKYMRRPDINSLMRIQIAVQAFTGMGIYGEITRIANEHKISRLFVYQLLGQLLGLFQPNSKQVISWQEAQRKLDQQILLLRLEGRCSLEAISRILTELGFAYTSIGYISQRILEFAKALPGELPTNARIVFYLSDETFANGQPILVTVDAQSLAILRIELATSRDAASWQAHWQELAALGYSDTKYVVSDLGKGLVKGCSLMGLTHHPDLFHLLQGIAIFISRFEKQAYAAIGEEAERLKVFENAKSERVLREKLALYEQAQFEAATAIALFDNFDYLWQQLKASFDLFDRQGNFKDPASNLTELLAIIELMKKLNCLNLNKELASFEKAIVAYWDYFSRAKDSYQEMVQNYGAELVNLVGLAWQYLRQATNSKNYQVKQYLTDEAQHYLNWAQSITSTGFAEMKTKIFATFNANIRASSLVENINSGLRKLLNNCRGQVSQAFLNLFAYVHNHRPFLRGTRKGSAPIEILTGKPLEKPWIDSLLDSLYQ